MVIVTSGQSDIGQVRDVNQDRFLIAELRGAVKVSSTNLAMKPSNTFYGNSIGEALFVADGMGGHAAGERASQLAVEFLAEHLIEAVQPSFANEVKSLNDASSGNGHPRESTFINRLVWLMRLAHAKILRESETKLEHRGMGTTFTMAYIELPRMIVLHAGDSRCYLIRDGEAKPITTDHTLAHKMVESGELAPEDEAKSRWSNVLWNVLGGQIEGELVTQVETVDLCDGDAVVLCSDGLHRYIDDAMLAMTVAEGDDPASICEELVRLANEAGGDDNITVTVSLIRQSRKSTGQTTLVEDGTIDDTATGHGEFDSFILEEGFLGSLGEMDTTMDDTISE
ncbi:Serine/threonine phosphatase stp [Planctomycetes bacterium CA13]|uniref:Serine/threonine phosphatase stp n=1 Tax=Novipirellula herctigrandis TaxID=2527986 RepID=A0A5C5Z4B3_9BACT|nr:Serine/threonine phosphatase stp [Planctomycetes bacterium CA13]